ncbi:WD40-repeat-containing domain protein, partial [Dimargaris cristalligena]
KSSAEYINIGANAVPLSAVWAPAPAKGSSFTRGFVAFGASNQVALFDPLVSNPGKLHTTALVSGSADKTARIWRPSPATGRWVCTAELTGHTYPVISVGVLPRPSDSDNNGIRVGEGDLIVTGSTDGTLRIYLRTDPAESESESDRDQIQFLQSISCGSRHPLAIALAYLPHSNIPILATGNTDSKIHIYAPQMSADSDTAEATPLFTHLLTLAGHESWVRCLAFGQFTEGGSDYLLLASGAQDKYIRLWKIKGYLSTKTHLLVIRSDAGLARFTVKIDAVVLGHDDWVYSVQWHPAQNTDDRPACLLSASADKSMILWRPDESTGIWISETRVGEMGGTSLGFYDGSFSPDGQQIIAHSTTGAFHLWSLPSETPGTDDSDDSRIVGQWQPQSTISGHTRSVQDLAWDPTARYLVSASLDQSARLFAPWRRSNTEGPVQTWHEIARPQIHGYDLQCLAFTGPYQFVSGADEKVIRVFDATGNFIDSLTVISQRDGPLVDNADRPVTANLPPLGLSNKAVFENDLQAVEAQEEDFLARQYSTGGRGITDRLRQALASPPLEEFRMQHSLWPETGKIYGHGYEIIAIAASHDGRVVASCCRATSEKHAVVRLVDTRTWLEYAEPLPGHSLTVTNLRFSPDDRWLLTVSRDRSWNLYERQPTLDDREQAPYRRVQTMAKAHARIIW